MLSSVSLTIPVPAATHTKCSMKPTSGRADLSTEEKAIVWDLPNLVPGKQQTLKADVTIPKDEALDWNRPPIRVECEPLRFNLSGFRARGVLAETIGKDKVVPFVRYSSMIGEFVHDI